MPHQPVMLDEALTGLGVHAHGIYIDGTYGRGGHSAAILERLEGTGQLHAFDRDPAAAADAWTRFGSCSNFRIHAACFSTLAGVCRTEGIAGRVNGVLFDLGVSSPQLDDAPRGFSLQRDGPLDMRMNPREGESAAQWLAHAREDEIADVLWRYGEERASRRIAHAIVAARQSAPIDTTGQLAALVLSVHRGPRQKIHPATRSFQAIRIHVNQELERLASGLQQAVDVLAPGGRLAVISFHSLEDRIVKRFMRGMGQKRDIPSSISHPPSPALRAVGRHFPAPEEAAANPRARSAVLRVAERLPPEARA
jgi:16S rRNA (cytosine1402-N4)-methyltransferase